MRRPGPHRLLTALVVAALASTGAACGPDDHPAGSPPTVTTTSPAPTTAPPTTTTTTVATNAPVGPSATITLPTDKGQVNETEVVKGSATGLPPDRSAWLVVQPISAHQYHPQIGPLTPAPDGSWVTVAHFGQPDNDDTNKQFLLMVVTTTQEGTGIFTQYLVDAPRNNYPGLVTLPNATITLATVVVTRR